MLKLFLLILNDMNVEKNVLKSIFANYKHLKNII